MASNRYLVEMTSKHGDYSHMTMQNLVDAEAYKDYVGRTLKDYTINIYEMVPVVDEHE